MDPALETIIQRSGIDLEVQSYVPVIEYVNGDLRGILNLREVNNDKFAYANWGYDDDEIDMFENFDMKQGNDSVIKRIFELGERINDEGAYDELTTLLDIDEYTNYMAMELYLLNSDWPNNNIKAYRSRHDARYRFISFDLDYVFGRISSDIPDSPFDYITTHNQSMKFVKFFQNMMNHDTYRRKFIDTFCLMGGSVFEENSAFEIIDELLSGGEKPLFTHSSAWTYNRFDYDEGTSAGGDMIDEYVVQYEEYPAIGSGGITYLGNSLYVNTFSLREYGEAIAEGRMSIMGRTDFNLHDRMRYRFLMQLFGLRLDKLQFERDFGMTVENGLPAEMTFMKLAGAFATDTPEELTLTPKGRYLVVAMMRQFFIGVNSLRDQARAALPAEERELLFG